MLLLLLAFYLFIKKGRGNKSEEGEGEEKGGEGRGEEKSGVGVEKKNIDI